jgi:DNA-binding beta-propeller fold protein YncE
MRKISRKRTVLVACAVSLVVTACAWAVAAQQSGVSTLSGGHFPRALALSPDGRTLYVADLDAPAANGAVGSLDLATGRLGRAVGVNGPPFRLVITPDGRMIFASDGGIITPVDAASGKAMHPIHTGVSSGAPGAPPLLMSRDGRTIYIAGDSEIRRYDIKANRFGSNIRADMPVDMVLSPDGRTLWYASAEDEIVEVSLASGRVIRRIEVGASPASLAITPDGRMLYVATGGGGHNDILPVSVSAGSVGQPIRLSDAPGPMVMAPNGHTLYVVVSRTTTDFAGYPDTSTGWVTPITLATRSAGSPIKVGDAPTDLVLAPDGRTLYVANQDSDTISVILVSH